MLRRLDETVRGWKVDLDQQEVVKFLPHNPPMVGDVVLVDGERCRVSSATIKWDGPRWELLGLRVKVAAFASPVVGERDE